MDCERAARLVSARLDGQIGSDDELVLDAHLSECESCRLLTDDLRHQDAELRRAFAARRFAAVAVGGRVLLDLARHKQRRTALRWVGMLTSAAAGFAAAVLMYRAPREAPAIPDPPAARLTLSTGAAEVMPPGSDTWHVLTAGTPVAAGSRLRTPPRVLCELVTTDGSSIRLNTDSELLLRGSHELELARGQVWTRVLSSVHAMQLDAPSANVTAAGAELDVRSESNHTTVTVASGVAIARGDGAEQIIHAGERLRVFGGQLAEKITVDDLTGATRWLNDILVLKGRDNPEVAARVDVLMERIAQPWMGYDYEEELRALGAHCVKPLKDYIHKACAPSEREQRLRAMSILADIAKAEPWAATAEVIELLSDADQEVCRLASEALRPLPGPRDEACLTCCEDAHRWHLWWQGDESRFFRSANALARTP